MVRWSYSVWKSIRNRTLSKVETAVHSRRKSLDTGQRKQRRRSLETKKLDNESAHRQAIGNKGRAAAKTNMKEFAGTARTSMHHCLEKVYQYLQRKLDVTDSSIEELGSATARKYARKRSRGQGRCELSGEREEKEVKIRGKVQAESAERESTLDKDM